MCMKLIIYNEYNFKETWCYEFLLHIYNFPIELDDLNHVVIYKR